MQLIRLNWHCIPDLRIHHPSSSVKRYLGSAWGQRTLKRVPYPSLTGLSHLEHSGQLLEGSLATSPELTASCRLLQDSLRSRQCHMRVKMGSVHDIQNFTRKKVNQRLVRTARFCTRSSKLQTPADVSYLILRYQMNFNFLNRF